MQAEINPDYKNQQKKQAKKTHLAIEIWRLDYQLHKCN